MQTVEAYKLKILYPTTLALEQSKDEMRKLVDIHKKLKINLSLCDFLSKVPKYAKYLEKMLLMTRKMDKASIFPLGKKCLEFFINKERLPQKLSDLGSFSFSCMSEG